MKWCSKCKPALKNSGYNVLFTFSKQLTIVVRIMIILFGSWMRNWIGIFTDY